jgi:lipopolysaccharide transport system ATP-binding protein
VKRYSSGMFVRLAFAVAAHLEPDILVVDEVLAVGDAGFQKKCLGRMGKVASQGRTVLFVSHNLQAIRSLCPRTVLLDKGRVITDGATPATLEAYRQALHQARIDADSEIHNYEYRRGTGAIRFTAIELMDKHDRPTYSFSAGDTIRFRLSYKLFKEMEGLVILVGLSSGMTQGIITSARHVITTQKVAAGTTGTVVVEFPDIPLRAGEYPVYCRISDGGGAHTNYDVVDGLTPPIIIWEDGESPGIDLDTYRLGGYFSLPSRLYVEPQEAVGNVSKGDK